MNIYANPSRRSSTVIPEIPKRRHPIFIVCVVKELRDASVESIQNIKKYTLEKNCMFETREYDPYKYRYDRDEIERLPAFHMEVNGIWQKTFYPNGRPYQIIGDSIECYLKHIQQLQEKKRKSFKIFLSSFITYIKRLGHRKTRMERVQEQEQYERNVYERKRSDSFRERMKSISEWE